MQREPALPLYGTHFTLRCSYLHRDFVCLVPISYFTFACLYREPVLFYLFQASSQKLNRGQSSPLTPSILSSSPSFSLPFLLACPHFPPYSLEVGPLPPIAARGSGGAFKLPSMSGRSPAAKRFWALENASSDNIFGSSM